METRNLIGGEWVGSGTGAELPVTDPATDAVIAHVPDSGADEARAAIAAARAALDGWRERTAAERAVPLHRLTQLMRARRDLLAAILTREQGKPLAEARGEIDYAASFIEWAAEEGRRILGETVPASRREQRILVLRQPVGVTAAITPWNFPAAMITRKLGPALAAGCTMVIKPASQTPLTAIALAELAMEAGLPAGTVNLVTGKASAIGGELLANSTVRKLSFTGSTEVGRVLVRGAAANLTRLSLELGGLAPFIVFDDADVDAAVKGAMASKFRNMGQTCICPNRFLVHRDVHDAFVTRLCAAVEAMVLGPGDEPEVTVGPLIDDAGVAKVVDHVSDAVKRGAKVLTGGRVVRPRPELTERWYVPTVLDGADPDMQVSCEETFGPVAAITTFTDDDQAIELANSAPYGLAAYFYTRDAARLLRVAERLEAGIIGANDGTPSTAQAPFGGVKWSGFGREGGHYVMNEYVDVKYVSWGGHA